MLATEVIFRSTLLRTDKNGAKSKVKFIRSGLTFCVAVRALTKIDFRISPKTACTFNFVKNLSYKNGLLISGGRYTIVLYVYVRYGNSASNWYILKSATRKKERSSSTVKAYPNKSGIGSGFSYATPFSTRREGIESTVQKIEDTFSQVTFKILYSPRNSVHSNPEFFQLYYHNFSSK